MEFTEEHYEELRKAKKLLENPGLTAKLTNLLGKPIERGFRAIPEKWKEPIREATKKSLIKGVEYLAVSFDFQKEKSSLDVSHKLAAIASGAAGGAFGFAALPIELPISTSIMLRSIMDIARSEGEDISRPEVKLACLEVFALGGSVQDDDSSETGYYAIRVALAKTITEAAAFMAERGFADKSAPAIVRLITLISARFGIIVSEKMAAQAVPIIGALAGGTINAIFMDHFQKMARGHFIVRRLESYYGEALVKETYRQIMIT